MTINNLELTWDSRYEWDPDTDCYNWLGNRYKEGGHGQVKIPKAVSAEFRGVVNTTAHRYAWFRVHGPIPAGIVLRHKCDNPICVNVDHIIPGTQAQNIQDMVDKKRYSKGPSPAHQKPRLTKDQVLHVKQRQANGETSSAIARDLNMSPKHIRRIARGEAWKSITL